MCMTKNFSHSHAVSYYFVKMCRHGRKKEKNSKTFLCLSSCVYVLHALLLLAFHSISTDDDSHRTIVRRDGNEEGGKKILHKRLKLQAFVTFFLRESSTSIKHMITHGRGEGKAQVKLQLMCNIFSYLSSLKM